MTISSHLRAAGWTLTGSPVAGAAGKFTPAGVMWHHYVGSCDPARAPAEAQSVRRPGKPAYQLTVDAAGRIYPISDGRAWHAGEGGPFAGWIPRDQGNALTVGISGHCSGAHPLSTHPEMYRVMVGVTADLCRLYGVGADRVLGHREYTSRKIDPRDNLGAVRQAVADLLNNRPPAGGTTPPAISRKDRPMIIQAPSSSWWLLNGAHLVSLTAQAAANARAGGLPAWKCDAASWTNLVRTFPTVPE